MTLTEQEKEMISDVLMMTKKESDIEENIEKMRGSTAFTPSEEAIKTYKELAKLRIKRK